MSDFNVIFFAFQKEASDKQRTSASSTYNTFPDDLYLDDQDALEGSGRGGGDNRDDLEASGSGLGPDDEDGDDDHGTSPMLFQADSRGRLSIGRSTNPR